MGSVKFQRKNPNDLRATIVACHICDTLHHIEALTDGKVAKCSNCRSRLLAHSKGGLDTPLALFLAAIPLFLVGNLFPLLTLDVQGLTQSTTITGASASLYNEGMGILGAIVWFTSVVGPGIIVLASCYVLLGLKYSRRLPYLRGLLIWTTHLTVWGMMDVFLLGILVALVKLVGLASVIPGPGLFAYGLLIFVVAAATAKLEPILMWQRLEELT